MSEHIKIRVVVGGYVVDVPHRYSFDEDSEVGEIICKTFGEVSKILSRCFIIEYPLQTGEILEILRYRKEPDHV